MKTLSELIHQAVPLTDAEKEIIEGKFSATTYKKGDFWIKQGSVCNKVAYVHSGKLRIFYWDGAGNEVTCYFVTEDNFISYFTSFLTNAPTHENISAIEDTLLYEIGKEDLELLSEQVPKIHIWRRIIAENLFITMEKRITMLQSLTAFERYEKMIQENPEIILSVPLQYTASFLGITPQHLSRLRKESLK